ncbi:MAG: hypothetical protein AB8B79_20415 [Granulosicoccus sp.]
MAVEDYEGTAIITIGAAAEQYDKDIYSALLGLHKKTNGYCIDWYNGTRGALTGYENLRLYLHGHGDFNAKSLGGLNASTIAQGLVGYFGLTKDTTKVISITGCNAARGTVCLDSVRNANVELIGKPVHPELPHLTRKWLTQDSRLVDTSKTAAELCRGSFAQQLHQELMTLGIQTTIYARLYVVVVEDDGQKRTMHYHYKPVWDPDGKNPHSSYHHGEKDRTKIKISATDGGQMFEYVQYDDNAKAQQRMNIRIAKAQVNQEILNRSLMGK